MTSFASLAASPQGQNLSRAASASPVNLVEFIEVEKIYAGHVVAVRRLDLEVRRGEFLTFLGPSGSGKTTTLNMLAGFERPTRGTIMLEGRSVDRLPPYERNIGMVFQNYALFPHMTVAENVAFPLSVRKIAKPDIASRVRRALEMVRLDMFGDRRPAQLSGGQQQRVALARALVYQPSLILMDEPLGALDKKLREHMQIELKQLHDQLGVTVVYVTHDQSEALTMSDRVAVFESGALAQIGKPDALYKEPADAFVANFIGENNTLEGTVEQLSKSTCVVRLGDSSHVKATPVGAMRLGDEAKLTIRPEQIRLIDAASDESTRLEGKVEGRIYLGDHQRLLVRLGNGQELMVKVPADESFHAGAPLMLSWSPADCRAFPANPRS
ncbi:MAG: ABC transporter ATP-binding protein [Hyphomicrobiales bacterium]|nr:ABC transporter ATP-binding protein [Hyphomicrobiales bacterium]